MWKGDIVYIEVWGIRLEFGYMEGLELGIWVDKILEEEVGLVLERVSVVI